MVGYLLAFATVALLWLLGRELWRALGPRLTATRDRRVRERDIAARVETALKSRGATPEQPIEVISASLVESEATSLPCVHCDADVVVEDHSVDTVGDEPLRVVKVHCRRCGHRRPVYLRIARELVH